MSLQGEVFFPERNSSGFRNRNAVVWVALALTLTLGVRTAAAQTPDPGCTSQSSGLAQLFVGIMQQTLEIACPTTNGPVTTKAYAVRVDPTAPGLSFETSTSSWSSSDTPFNTELTTAFLQRTGSQVAVNASFFTNYSSDTTSVPTALCGLEISGGQVLSPLKNKPDRCDPSFPFDTSLTVTGKAVAIATLGHVDSTVSAAVTGSHLLVSSGQNIAPQDPTSSEFFGPNARTLVGLSAGNDVLWIVVVERSRSSGGVTLPQAAQLMMQLGAWTALNLDGGGSTSLAVDAGGGKVRLLNTPNDYTAGCTFPKNGKCERYVGASLGIHAQPLPPASR
jgi:hypothetical protein